MQVVLLAIVTFLFAIDQFSLTEIIYRPICACPIIGAILGRCKYRSGTWRNIRTDDDWFYACRRRTARKRSYR